MVLLVSTVSSITISEASGDSHWASDPLLRDSLRDRRALEEAPVSSKLFSRAVIMDWSCSLRKAIPDFEVHGRGLESLSMSSWEMDSEASGTSGTRVFVRFWRDLRAARSCSFSSFFEEKVGRLEKEENPLFCVWANINLHLLHHHA